MSMAAIVITGNVGTVDLDDKTFDDPVLKISVAVNTGKKGDNEITNWYSCQVWGKRATALHPHIEKGSQVVIAGRLTVREYTAKDGEKRYSLDVQVDQFSFAGGGKDKGSKNDTQTKKSSRWD